MKETFRDGAFETNSSTMHTITFYNKHCNGYKNRKFFDITKNKGVIISLMSYSQWMYKTHIGFIEKYRALLTDALMAHSWCASEYLHLFNVVNDILLKKYGIKVTLDTSRINSKKFLNSWHKYSDGCAQQIVDYGAIIRDYESRKHYRKNSVSVYKKLLSKRNKLNSKECYDVRICTNLDCKDHYIIESVDNIIEFLVSNNITLYIQKD